MAEVYYKCPVCREESYEPGYCNHGNARVSMQKTMVIENPINKVPFYRDGTHIYDGEIRSVLIDANIIIPAENYVHRSKIKKEILFSELDTEFEL